MTKEFKKKLSMKIAAAVRQLRTFLYYVLTLTIASPFLLLIFVLVVVEKFIRIDYKRRSKMDCLQIVIKDRAYNIMGWCNLKSWGFSFNFVDGFTIQLLCFYLSVDRAF